jgi:hypothetical protein
MSARFVLRHIERRGSGVVVAVEPLVKIEDEDEDDDDSAKLLPAAERVRNST